VDVYCPVCGEPWDLDTLHEIDAPSYQAKRKRFQREGCGALETAHNEPADGLRASASAALFDVLGDDVDGIAATLEDADAAGWFDASRFNAHEAE
jgi:hypothetical protein